MRSAFRPPRDAVSWSRLWIALGGLATVIGIFVAGAAPVARTPGAERAPAQQAIGGAVVLVGWVLLAWGLHRFGRAGAAADD